MIIIAIILTFVLLLLIGESLIINQSTGKLHPKIHVNGTRGKSTVVKYIHAALNGSGFRTVGKITGEVPTLLLPDGSSKVIKRYGPARVQEQFNVIRKSSRKGVDAMVIECMSIEPSFQKAESKFYKPDIYIITNIRDDHREVMGTDHISQLKSICSAIPPNSKVIAVESTYVDMIKEETGKRNSVFVKAVSLHESEKEKLPVSIFESNVSLALTACIECGMKRQPAFSAILKQSTKTETPVYHLKNINRNSYFLNAFSVNDTQSASDFINYWMSNLNIAVKISVILNTRADRPLRTSLFTDWIRNNQSIIAKVIITGDHKWKAMRLLTSMNLNMELLYLKEKRRQRVKDSILNKLGDSELLVGIGNMHGLGHFIIKEFSKAS